MSVKELDVGAVIVNYNAGSHLIGCVQSLKNEGVKRIILVDNGSSDDSIEMLKGALGKDDDSDVEVVYLPHNPGFGAGMNKGVSLLDNATVLCLNPDTVIEPGALQLLDAKLYSDDHMAVVGPRLLDSDRTVYPSARNFPAFSDGVGHALLGLVWAGNPWSNRYKKTDLDRNSPSEVDWISGAAMYIRRAAFDEVKGFDESYFMYMEDVDLCWRLRKAGWKVAYAPEAAVVHVRGVSTDKSPYRFIIAHHKSLLRYTWRTSEGLSRVTLPIIAVGLALRVPVACAHRWLIGKKAAKAIRTRRKAQSG